MFATRWLVTGVLAKSAAPAGGVATASGTIPLTGSATGALAISATGGGTIAVQGQATGALAIQATASGTIPISGSASASAVSGVSASASGTISVSGSASGSLAIVGQAAQTIGISGSATGQLAITATASGTIDFTGSASGTSASVIQGQASGTIPISGSATGQSGASEKPGPARWGYHSESQRRRAVKRAKTDVERILEELELTPDKAGLVAKAIVRAAVLVEVADDDGLASEMEALRLQAVRLSREAETRAVWQADLAAAALEYEFRQLLAHLDALIADDEDAAVLLLLG
jgi:hypothetical protein